MNRPEWKKQKGVIIMIDDYLEYDKKNDTIKLINLDSFSLEDLKNYIQQLRNEINRVEIEINKKIKLQSEANKIFKQNKSI